MAQITQRLDRPVQPGDQLPDFEAATLGGQAVNYRGDVWQKKLVVIVTFLSPASAEARSYRAALVEKEHDLTAHDTMLLVRDRASFSGLLGVIPTPSVIVADRWGEVRDVEHPPDDGGLPAIDAIVEWLRFIQLECPECQGEMK